jgi:uncharacterized protein DUF4396
MEAAAPADHRMAGSGRELDKLAANATAHCLTGCAIGEIAGLAIGTALGWGNLATILLAIALAFFFGYSLTSLPLLRAGMALAAVVPIALASDTFSIAVMEIVDNAIVLVVPGAMDAGLGDLLFWGSLALALAIAFAAAWPVNRALIARGKGHAVAHEHHHVGHADGGGQEGMGPYTFGRVMAVIGAMFAFGAPVVVFNVI